MANEDTRAGVSVYEAGTEERPNAGDRSSTPSRANALDRWLTRRLLRRLGVPDVGIVLWDGQEVGSSDRTLVRVKFNDRRTLLRFFIDPRLSFGDGYASGRVEILGDLCTLMETTFRAWADRPAQGPGWLGLFCSNPLSRARDNVYHHYDLGNDFYQLWLDERMLYTCAYFPDPNLSIDEAQLAKMDHVCRKLWLRPGESVVEAGCGWGALAMHAARHYGVKVRAFNLSHEQIAYAREQARREGLAGRVEFVEDDFRNITGQYDAFMSVGMLEHVHLKNYRRLGDLIHRSLKPSGRGLIHSIGRNRPRPMDSWLKRRIFPGAYIPALSEIMQVFEPRNFSVLDVENLRFHYARTLECWLERFERVADQVERKYDAAFVRTWRLYLVSSMAAFRAGAMQLFQVVFAPNANVDVPWSRAHVYQP